MATENGSVWGNEVIVPEGEKIHPSAAAHVKPVGGGDNSGGGNNGNENDDGDSGDGGGDDTRTDPVILMPDGSEVTFDEFAKDNDPFAEQRAELREKELRLDGYAEAIRNGNGNGNGNGDESGTGDPGSENEPTHPLLADNPLLEEIEVTEDSMYSEEHLALIEKHNNVVKYSKEQNQAIVGIETDFDKKLGTLTDTISDRFFREDVQRVIAQTGVTEAELAAANKATGVSDIDTLATVVMGQKARAAAADEARTKADEERRTGAGNIGGSSRNTNSGGGDEDDERRGVKDWRNKEEVGKAYNFRAAE